MRASVQALRTGPKQEGGETQHCKALTISELKGFALALRMELLVRLQTLVLCLKAALTFEDRTEDG